MRRILSVMVAIVAVLSLSSCEKEALDGDWEKMKWEKTSYTTEKYEGHTYYRVPKEGGTFTFKCKNYSAFWLCNLLEVVPGYGTNKETYYLANEADPHKLECGVATVHVENATVTITIAPTDSSLRTIHLSVTAGDIFDDFSFIQ